MAPGRISNGDSGASSSADVSMDDALPPPTRSSLFHGRPYMRVSTNFSLPLSLRGRLWRAGLYTRIHVHNKLRTDLDEF
jgi:hypothetical protein